MFSPEVLDITDEDMMEKVMAGLANVAAVSLEASYPNDLSIPHFVTNAFKNVLAVALEADYSFPLADKVHFSV